MSKTEGKDKYNILLAGVGGMGILTASRLITGAAIIENKNALMSEIHGLSQRGGMVYTMVRLGNVSSPLIKEGAADALIALESTESLRYLDKVAPDSVVIVNNNLVIPPLVTAGYGQTLSLSRIKGKLKSFSSNVTIIPALEIAEEMGNPIVQNTILVGVFFSSHSCPLSEESGKKVIERRFREKGKKIVDLNMQAFERGLEIGHNAFS